MERKQYLYSGKENTILFYAAFALMVFAKAFGLYRADKIYYVLFAVSAAMLAVRILLMKKTKEDFGKLALLLLPGTAVFLYCRETTLLFTCLFLAASKEIDFDFSMKWCLRIYIFAIPLRLLLYFCGLVEGGEKAIYLHNSAGESYLAGYTYGYGYPHPNVLFITVFVAVLLYLYVRKDELGWKEIVAPGIVMVFTFLVTKSKAGLLISLAVMFALVLQRYVPHREQFIRLYCALMIGASLIVGIVLPLLYSADNPILYFINKFVITGRLRWAKEALMEAGVSLLGGGNAFLDILYMDVLINSGIAGFCMLMAGVIALPISFAKRRNYVGLLCASAMVLYACMEQFPLNIAMNPFVLYLGTDVLFEKNKISI